MNTSVKTTQPLSVSVLLGSFLGMDIGASDYRSYSNKLWMSTQLVFTRHLETAQFSSLFELLDDHFEVVLGFVPEHMTLALPGFKDGKVQSFSNLVWPEVAEDEVRRRYGCKAVSFVNDLEAAAYGVSFYDTSLIETLCYGQDPATRNGSRVTYAVSTGNNQAFSNEDGTLACETGWNRPPFLPGRGNAYFHYVWEQLERPPVLPVELTISGKVGLGYMYDWLVRQHWATPSTRVVAAVADLRARGKGVGPAITTGAVAGDEFCLDLADLLGEIIGADLHSAFGAQLPGEIYLVGSVVAKTPGFAQLLLETEGFQQAFYAPGTKFEDARRKVYVGVVHDPADEQLAEVAAVGALHLAYGLR